MAKVFITLLFPLIILAFGIWFCVTSDIERGNVRVAGAMLGTVDADFTVKCCRLQEGEGARRLVVELDVINEGSEKFSVNPFEFQLVLGRREQVAGGGLSMRTFRPIRCASASAPVPDDISVIQPNTARSYSLYFWGESLPTGEEWNDCYLSLEYYDPAIPILLSKPLRPENI